MKLFETSISKILKSISLLSLLFFMTNTESTAQLTIYNGLLNQECKIGVDDGHSNRQWLKDKRGYIELAYPGDLLWGAVFITFGKPYPDDEAKKRKSKDLSAYSKLVIDLKGQSGGEVVNIGMKDAWDPNDGSETKIPQTVTGEWETYSFDLKDFDSCDLKMVHVPAEFVLGNDQATVFFKNIRFE